MPAPDEYTASEHLPDANHRAGQKKKYWGKGNPTSPVTSALRPVTVHSSHCAILRGERGQTVL
jgi:hypothetical protein